MERELLWQNREIRFDVDQKMLQLCSGEQLVDRMDNVEDTKGNNGDRGTIRITNIRLIWHATNMPRINLSIGWSCVSAIHTRYYQRARDRDHECIYVFARTPNNTTRFEFVFTCLPPSNHTRLVTTMMSVYRAYETTRLYRELKMRGAMVDDAENLRLLPQEQLCDRVTGVWNLSQDQGGSLGNMFITNCRVVWYASTNIQYNVSVPFLQMFSVRLRDSKFGMALVIETTPSSGEYVLGFRMSPNEKLKAVCAQILALMKAYMEKPIFGVMLTREKPPTPRIVDSDALDPIEDDVDTVDDKILRTDAFAAYFTEGTTATGDDAPKKLPVYSEELGLAVEPPKNGFTISDLWNIRVD